MKINNGLPYFIGRP